jgi:hypothetical protein
MFKTLGSFQTAWCYKAEHWVCTITAARTSNPTISNLNCHVCRAIKTTIFLLKTSPSTGSEQVGAVVALQTYNGVQISTREAAIQAKIFHSFPQSIQQMLGKVTQSAFDHFLPNLILFISHSTI